MSPAPHSALRLQPPNRWVRRSFLAAMAEFAAEGRGGAEDRSAIGDELRDPALRWDTEQGFTDYVAALIADAFLQTPRAVGRVPCTTLWYLDGEEYLGRFAIRHHLTAALLEYGGHIGYDVRPTARRRGHGTEMLRRGLPIARGLGLDRVLLTCSAGNLGSRRVIETNGGVLEQQRDEQCWYWISTHPER